MKSWQPMQITVIGNVTEVVMGGNKHSGKGGGGKNTHSWKSWSFFSWPW